MVEITGRPLSAARCICALCSSVILRPMPLIRSMSYRPALEASSGASSYSFIMALSFALAILPISII